MEGERQPAGSYLRWTRPANRQRRSGMRAPALLRMTALTPSLPYLRSLLLRSDYKLTGVS